MRGSVLPLLQVPDWFLNRQRDFRDGKTSQIVSSTVDSKLREDFERLKKIRSVAVQLLCLYQNLVFVVWCMASLGVAQGKGVEQPRCKSLQELHQSCRGKPAAHSSLVSS